MRRSIFERELLPIWKNRLLTEITPDDLRAHCGKIVDLGAPATAIHVRDILKQIYGFAILHGERIAKLDETDATTPILTIPSPAYRTSRVALSLRDPETDSLARQVASLTGETLTEAVRGALRLRLRDEQLKRGERPWDDAAIDAIIERFNALPVFDTRTPDEILGYDENGLPS